MALHLPSPPVNGFHAGPAFIHFYGLMYVIGITAAILITQRRWKAQGGDPALVGEVALWAVPAGIIGGRIYFDITTPKYIPHHWYGLFAVWDGGLGIWGAIALAAVVGAWRVRRHGASPVQFMDAVAPALLVAQAIGRIGNYFNQELFGGPTSLPWGLQIAPQFRPAGFARYATFQPTFLYELIFDLALAAALVWLGHHRTVRPPGLFALYVTGYSAFRMFEESLRVDPSEHFLGLRLNMYVAGAVALAGAAWFWRTQRRARRRNSRARRSAGPARLSEPPPAVASGRGTAAAAVPSNHPATPAAGGRCSAAGAAVLGRNADQGLLHMLAAAGPGDLLTAVADSRAAHLGPPWSVRRCPDNTTGGILASGLTGCGQRCSQPLQGAGSAEGGPYPPVPGSGRRWAARRRAAPPAGGRGCPASPASRWRPGRASPAACTAARLRGTRGPPLRSRRAGLGWLTR